MARFGVLGREDDRDPREFVRGFARRLAEDGPGATASRSRSTRHRRRRRRKARRTSRVRHPAGSVRAVGRRDRGRYRPAGLRPPLGRGRAPRHGLRGGAVHDARIAAIRIDHGVDEPWSCDRDFARFPDLSVSNPLIPSIHEPLPASYAAHRVDARLRGELAPGLWKRLDESCDHRAITPTCESRSACRGHAGAPTTAEKVPVASGREPGGGTAYGFRFCTIVNSLFLSEHFPDGYEHCSTS